MHNPNELQLSLALSTRIVVQVLQWNGISEGAQMKPMIAADSAPISAKQHRTTWAFNDKCSEVVVLQPPMTTTYLLVNSSERGG